MVNVAVVVPAFVSVDVLIGGCRLRRLDWGNHDRSRVRARESVNHPPPGVVPVLDPAAVLQGLDPEQRRVAEALRGPVRVLAGAGTGKTRAITHRIAYGVATGVYNPHQVLAVTFTTRAAGEMRSRLSALGATGVQARTFHSAALRQARYFWPKVYGVGLPELVE